MLFFTPGPSQLFPTVEGHIKRALKDGVLSVSHRSGFFEKQVTDTKKWLRKLLNVPQDWQIFFLASATEAMERVIQNTANSTSFHFINGAFSERFWKIAKSLNKEALETRVNYGRWFEFGEINIPKRAELICLTQTETSTGVALKMEDVYGLKKRYPAKLIALDVVSSVPVVKIDFKWLDCVFFSVQKGFGLPAGLGVLLVSPRAMRKTKRLGLKFAEHGYHSFEQLFKYAGKNQTPETPNVLAIYLLGKVSEDMVKMGIDKIRLQIEKKANLVKKAVGVKPRYNFFVKSESMRAETVIVLEVKGGSGALIKKLAKSGFIVGSGYGELKNKQIRIANFPATGLKSMRKLVRCL